MQKKKNGLHVSVFFYSATTWYVTIQFYYLTTLFILNLIKKKESLSMITKSQFIFPSLMYKALHIKAFADP